MFNIGDYVQVIKSGEWNVPFGTVGKVVRYNPDDATPYTLEFDPLLFHKTSYTTLYREDELQLVNKGSSGNKTVLMHGNQWTRAELAKSFLKDQPGLGVRHAFIRADEFIKQANNA